MAWRNPDTSKSLTFDGVQGRVTAKVTSGGADPADIPPTVSVVWDESTDLLRTYDLKPATAFNSASTEIDTENNVLVVDPADNLG